MKISFVFPGQGSQHSGMLADVYHKFSEARDVFHEVDDVLGFKLSDMILNGTEDNLRQTENAQPSLLCVSIAITRVITAITGRSPEDLCRYVAGHSLGEYSALCFAGSISLRDASLIVRKRGELMQASAPFGTGGMAAIIGLSLHDVEELIDSTKESDVLVVANDNSTTQVVISGANAAIDRAILVAKDRGAKIAIKLQVSGPFHSPFMKKAADELMILLSNISFSNPKVPVISNVTASPHVSVVQIQELLCKQVTERVRWTDTVKYLQNSGVRRVYEIGPKDVLCGLIKRITKDIECNSIGSVESIESNFSSVMEGFEVA